MSGTKVQMSVNHECTMYILKTQVHDCTKYSYTIPVDPRIPSFAFKKPVISTRSHGIPSTVMDNKNGILVEPENPEQLAEGIKKLLLDEDLKKRLGQFGYNFVHEECNCVSMAKKSLKLYEQVLKINHNK